MTDTQARILQVIAEEQYDYTLSEYEGEPFVIIEGWEALGNLNERVNTVLCPEWEQWNRIYLEATRLYTEDSRLGWTPTGGPFGDLRLSLQDDVYYKTGDSRAKPYYRVPEGVIDFDDHGIEFGFSDEWDTCSKCLGVIRTSPDSYGWQPDYHRSDYDGLVCSECLDPDDYLKDHKNRNALVNTYLVDPDDHGYTLIEDVRFEAGLHRGQNADPNAIVELLNSYDYDVIFTGSVGQFDVNFNVWVKANDDREAEHGAEVNDAYVRHILETGATRLPYDPGTELGKVLRGESSDHYVLETRTITAEEFVSGSYLKD